VTDSELDVFVNRLVETKLDSVAKDTDRLAYDKSPFVRIVPLTPSATLDDVKRVVNYLINQLNKEKQYG